MTKPKMVQCEAFGRKVYPPPTQGDINYCPNPKCQKPLVPIKKTTLSNGKVEWIIDCHERRVHLCRAKHRVTPKYVRGSPHRDFGRRR